MKGAKKLDFISYDEMLERATGAKKNVRVDRREAVLVTDDKPAGEKEKKGERQE